MKFSLDSEVEFEAKDLDQALIKLALHFMSLMESSPILLIGDNPPLDMVKIIKSGVPPLNENTTEGYIDVDFITVHERPELMQ